MNFRVIEWALGNKRNHDTNVSIQCISDSEPALDRAREAIDRICGENGIRVTEASGPQFDKRLLKKLN